MATSTVLVTTESLDYVVGCCFIEVCLVCCFWLSMSGVLFMSGGVGCMVYLMLAGAG